MCLCEGRGCTHVSSCVNERQSERERERERERECVCSCVHVYMCVYAVDIGKTNVITVIQYTLA